MGIFVFSGAGKRDICMFSPSILMIFVFFTATKTQRLAGHFKSARTKVETTLHYDLHIVDGSSRNFFSPPRVCALRNGRVLAWRSSASSFS